VHSTGLVHFRAEMGGGTSKNAVAPAEAAGQLRDTLQQLQEEKKSHSKLQVVPGTPAQAARPLPASVDQAHRADGSQPTFFGRMCRSSHCTAACEQPARQWVAERKAMRTAQGETADRRGLPVALAGA
jgi:hypothetical protein